MRSLGRHIFSTGVSSPDSGRSEEVLLVELFAWGADLFLTLAEGVAESRYGSTFNVKHELAAVRVVGGFTEVLAAEALKLSKDLDAIRAQHKIGVEMDACDVRLKQIREKLAPFESVQAAHDELERVKAEIAEEWKKVPTIQAAVALGGDVRKGMGPSGKQFLGSFNVDTKTGTDPKGYAK